MSRNVETQRTRVDPYLKQIYKVRLDGSGLTLLSEPADGQQWLDHALQVASPVPSGGTAPADALLSPRGPGADGALSPSGNWLLDEVSSVRPEIELSEALCLALQVWVEIMGSQNCGIVGKYQPVLVMINPMI